MLPLLVGAGVVVLGVTIAKKVIAKTAEDQKKDELIKSFCESDQFESFKEKYKDKQEISELMKDEILTEIMELDFESKYPNWSRGFLSDIDDKEPLKVDSMEDYIDTIKDDVLDIKISTELGDITTLNGIGKTDLEPHIEMRIKVKSK